jgi:hypothetical protein
MSVPTLHWNCAAHEQWAGEQLYFWRLAFHPTYRHEKIKDALERVMIEHKVSSYTAYELYGVHDLLLRIWLPKTTQFYSFQESLVATLRAEDLRVCEPFIVSRCIRHWPFEHRTPLVPPKLSDNVQIPSTEIAEDITRHGKGSSSYKTYWDAGVVADVTHGEGIKFFIVVVSTIQPGNFAALNGLSLTLERILDDAKDVNERSLYQGSGFGQFLVMGRVTFQDYYWINERILAQINDEAVQDAFGVRSFTSIGARRELVLREEHLVLPRQAGDRHAERSNATVEVLLQHDESQELEVKGSAFFNIDRWLNEDNMSWKDKGPSEALAKAVVGMLNTEGGIVVVGALEADRYDKHRIWSEFPHIGKYICSGINVDYQNKGWDAFQLRLQDKLGRLITPDPFTHIDIKREEVESATGVSIDLCLIAVDPRRSNGEWFYLANGNSDLLIRVGAQTRSLKKTDADRHRESTASA